MADQKILSTSLVYRDTSGVGWGAASSCFRMWIRICRVGCDWDVGQMWVRWYVRQYIDPTD